MSTITNTGDRCDACGRTYSVIYRVPNAVWAAIAPHPETLGDHPEHYYGGMLCPDCAVGRAEEQGIRLLFVAEHRATVSISSALALEPAPKPAIPARDPFDPGDDFDAMAESFRLQMADMALRAHKTAVYRDLGPVRQLQCFMAGAVTGLVGVCFCSIDAAGRDAMMEAIVTYLPVARQNVEETEAEAHG